MAKLLIMKLQESDLSRMLSACFEQVAEIGMNEPVDMEAFDAFAVLGGTQDALPALLPHVSASLLIQRKKGKRVFCEYTAGVGEACFANPVPTNCDRPVCVRAGEDQGVILDEQSNTRVPVQFLPESAEVWYQYVTRPDGYRRAPVPSSHAQSAAIFYEPVGLLQCAFRMANFAKARFTPFRAWKHLLQQIVSFLGGEWNEDVAEQLKLETYSLAGQQSVARAIEKSSKWFEHSGVFVKILGIPRAVQEGVSSVILPDGYQAASSQIRLDAIGETALMYELRYQVYHQKRDREWADALYETLRAMQYKDGNQKGMVRGSLGWWQNASYQDDASRGFLIPLATRAWLTGDFKDEQVIRAALDYLLQSTGTDGLRVNQVNWQSHQSDRVRVARLEKRGTKWKNSGFYETTIIDLKNMPADNPSGHYNGWYLAALVLCGILFHEPRYVDAGKHGLTTIMSVYPWTAREHSQTQEICRLILPLSLLVMAENTEKHRAWLDTVLSDLRKMEYSPGAFVEYDEGYTASCSRAEAGECSVFSHNGDPVCDFLYSMNWLPVSLAAAWYVSKKEEILALYKRTVQFIAKVQIESPEPKLCGAWARAVDAETLEINGVNNDREWSIWTIESGWTVAEITIGMLWGMYLGLTDIPQKQV